MFGSEFAQGILPGTQIPYSEIALRLLAATIFGLLVGWDRERRDKPAGLRTHALVSLGSASFVILALEMVAGPLRYSEEVRPDPTRVIEGIIGGIGFLGAGSIIQLRGAVQGLTTGASIWAVGAIGVACASGFLLVAAMITAITLVVLIVVGHFEHVFLGKRGPSDEQS